MITQTRLFVFFALFLLTLAEQEHVNSPHHDNQHKLSASKRAIHNQHQPLHRLLHHRLNVKSSDENKNGSNSSSASDNSTSGFELIYSERSSLYAVVKVSGNAAIIHDYNSDIIALYDGKSAVVFDLNSSTVSRVNSSQSVWSSSNESFAAYLGNLSSLKSLVEAGKQTEQNFSSVDESTLKDINKILLQIGDKESASEKLNHIFVKGKIVSSYLKGPLHGFFKGNGSIHIHRGVKWVANTLRGIGALLENVHGGVEGLNKGGVEFNLTEIFNGSSGTDVVLIILTEIGQRKDLAQLLGNVLNNPEKILQVIAGFNRTTGVDGLITIIYNIVITTSGRGSIETTIQAIFQYSSNGGIFSAIGPDFNKIIDDLLNLTASQDKVFHNAAGLQGFIQFLQSIRDSNAVLNNIKVSEIITLLRNTDIKGGVNLASKIFLSLGDSGIHFFPNIFQQAIKLLNSSSGLGQFTKLVPGLNLSSFSNSTNALQNILQGLNLTQILGNNSDITSAVSHIPVVGDIFKQITSSINGSFDISKTFNASSIIGIFQNIAGGGGFGNILQQFSNITSLFGQGGNIVSSIQHGISEGISNIQQSISGVLGGIGGNHQENTSSSSNNSSTQQSASTAQPSSATESSSTAQPSSTTESSSTAQTSSKTESSSTPQPSSSSSSGVSGGVSSSSGSVSVSAEGSTEVNDRKFHRSFKHHAVNEKKGHREHVRVHENHKNNQ